MPLRKIFIGAAVFAMVGVVGLLGLSRYVDSLPIGTGEVQMSPDGRFQASVMSFSEKSFFTGASRRWFEIGVSGPDVLYEFTSRPLPGPPFGSREHHSVISWKPDSSSVRFDFPTAKLEIKTQR
ncbi:hypothetical protein [Afifella marina]|uniref:Uncharacterized protein n=1 Tax=Afifella marina DSM 2698 TaxID=1120955 RepID=A0A1G5MWX6_AFIMA|nr:hypothetical protein [Afifella marina]SCZ29138.1 hypothetical protein SAMN03080610_01091 [Afifella marina DSM 2698]